MYYNANSSSQNSWQELILAWYRKSVNRKVSKRLNASAFLSEIQNKEFLPNY